jgi:hypothetical protein
LAAAAFGQLQTGYRSFATPAQADGSNTIQVRSGETDTSSPRETAQAMNSRMDNNPSSDARGEESGWNRLARWGAASSATRRTIAVDEDGWQIPDWVALTDVDVPSSNSNASLYSVDSEFSANETLIDVEPQASVNEMSINFNAPTMPMPMRCSSRSTLVDEHEHDERCSDSIPSSPTLSTVSTLSSSEYTSEDMDVDVDDHSGPASDSRSYADLPPAGEPTPAPAQLEEQAQERYDMPPPDYEPRDGHHRMPEDIPDAAAPDLVSPHLFHDNDQQITFPLQDGYDHTVVEYFDGPIGNMTIYSSGDLIMETIGNNPTMVQRQVPRSEAGRREMENACRNVERTHFANHRSQSPEQRFEEQRSTRDFIGEYVAPFFARFTDRS